MKLPYNPDDKNSIIAYAKKLKGKALCDVCDKDLIKTWKEEEVFWSNTHQTAERTSIIEAFEDEDSFKYHTEWLESERLYCYLINKLNSATW